MSNRKVSLRHRGRLFQIPIYLGKMLRGFVYMSDWKMLPMSAVIAALVCMVVRKGFFMSMDGTLKGSFAFCCVAIWNGCFNSIQVICRERPIVKREHRSGMHISSYICAHMIYQALLCIGQTIVLIYVSSLCGVKFPTAGFITSSFKVDIGITLFIIAFASDMLSLLISAIAHTTTAAMTVMPFILIFQLVFSGGFWSLPNWANSVTRFAISNYGLKCVNAQSDYNNLPLTTAWTALERMENEEIKGSFTIGEAVDMLGNDEGPLKGIRSNVIDFNQLAQKAEAAAEAEAAAGETAEIASTEETVTETPAEEVPAEATVTEAPVEEAVTEAPAEEAVTEAPAGNALAEESVTEAPVEEAPTEAAESEAPAENAETEAPTEEAPTEAIASEAPAEEVAEAAEMTAEADAPAENASQEGVYTVGQIFDAIRNTGIIDPYRDVVVPFNFRVGDIIDSIGRDTLKTAIETKSANSMAKEDYTRSVNNIARYWMILGGFALFYALLAMIVLEFIDKDKR